MKISKSYLKQLVAEEITSYLKEGYSGMSKDIMNRVSNPSIEAMPMTAERIGKTLKRLHSRWLNTMLPKTPDPYGWDSYPAEIRTELEQMAQAGTDPRLTAAIEHAKSRVGKTTVD
tara:strand:- start:46 stop:393 length:348 start_codon:yes stop_codon:yes gene_type:complete